MLPPFVPPSARVPAQSLPLITEFVFDRGERPPEPAFSADSWAPDQSSGNVGVADDETVALLPSIDEFLMLREPTDLPAPTRQAAAPDQEAQEAQEAQEEPAAEENVPQQPPQQPPQERPEEQGQDDTPAVPVESPPELAETSADMTSATATSNDEGSAEGSAEYPIESEISADQSEERAAEERASGELPTEAWVTEERNSFDWQAASNLAQPGDEERRASEEWSATEWDRQTGSPQDHVVSLLAQLARRVRSGELNVRATRQMSAEAVLAAVLVALLTEADEQ